MSRSPSHRLPARLMASALFVVLTSLDLAACDSNLPPPPPPATLREGSMVFCTDGGLPPCE